MQYIELYTDGACSNNPGPGGWAAVLLHKSHKKELSGFVRETTNNRMELYAPLQGLKALKRPCRVDIYSDSAYLVNAFNRGWIERWQRTGWKTAAKQPVENQDLWQALLEEVEKHDVKFIKVPGHADNEYNNRCDYLAKEQIKKNAGETMAPEELP
ncbi:MAG: ribonuclease HI [Christensenellales bacterium]|jgi:ribonuclease HI